VCCVVCVCCVCVCVLCVLCVVCVLCVCCVCVCCVCVCVLCVLCVVCVLCVCVVCVCVVCVCLCVYLFFKNAYTEFKVKGLRFSFVWNCDRVWMKRVKYCLKCMVQKAGGTRVLLSVTDFKECTDNVKALQVVAVWKSILPMTALR